MPSGKSAATVLVTTHLPTDFQGDVKSDSRLDFPLFPHPLCIPDPAFGWKGCCTQPPVKAEPSSAVHRCWVWRHRCLSCSKIQLSTPAALETAKTALHCEAAPFQDGWKALKGTGTPCKSSGLVPFQRQIDISLFVQDSLSYTRLHKRQQLSRLHTNEGKLMWGKANVERSHISRVTGSTLLWGRKLCFPSLGMRGSWRRPAGNRQLSRGAGRLIPCNPDVCQHELESSRQEKTELWKLYPALLKALLSEYQLALT